MAQTTLQMDRMVVAAATATAATAATEALSIAIDSAKSDVIQLDSHVTCSLAGDKRSRWECAVTYSKAKN